MKKIHQTDKSVWIGIAHIIEDLSGQFRTCQLIARRNHDDKVIVEIHPANSCHTPTFVVDLVDGDGIIHTKSNGTIVARSLPSRGDHFELTPWRQEFMASCLG